MIEFRKVIVFLFAMILFIYLIYTSFYSLKAYKLKKLPFIVMIIGLGLITSGTFIDMLTNLILNKFDNVMKVCFTAGAVIFIVGMAIWDRYLRKTILVLYISSHTDSMTGAYNRKGIEQAFERTIKSKEAFYVMAMDLDGTKKVNDKYGHLSGDKYIIEASKIINEEIGIKGFLGRTGGDEFVVLLGHCSERELEEIKSAIKQRISKIFPGETTRISIGCSLYGKDGENPKQLISVADSRMYMDKKSGSHR